MRPTARRPTPSATAGSRHAAPNSWSWPPRTRQQPQPQPQPRTTSNRQPAPPVPPLAPAPGSRRRLSTTRRPHCSSRRRCGAVSRVRDLEARCSGVTGHVVGKCRNARGAEAPAEDEQPYTGSSPAGAGSTECARDGGGSPSESSPLCARSGSDTPSLEMFYVTWDVHQRHAVYYFTLEAKLRPVGVLVQPRGFPLPLPARALSTACVRHNRATVARTNPPTRVPSPCARVALAKEQAHAKPSQASNLMVCSVRKRSPLQARVESCRVVWQVRAVYVRQHHGDHILGTAPPEPPPVGIDQLVGVCGQTSVPLPDVAGAEDEVFGGDGQGGIAVGGRGGRPRVARPAPDGHCPHQRSCSSPMSRRAGGLVVASGQANRAKDEWGWPVF